MPQFKTTFFPYAGGVRSAAEIFWLSVLVIGMLLLTGCSTLTLTDGANLAKAGQAAASQMQKNAILSADAVLGVRKAVAFNDGFNGQIGNPSSAKFLKNLSDIQARQAQYGKLLQSLASAYSALGDLATYDAVGNFNTSLNALASDTKKFAGTVGAQINIPSEATSVIRVAGGQAIASAQVSEVKKGSRKIEVILKQVIAVLDAPDTREKLIPAQDHVVGQIDQAAVILFSAGIYSYSPLLNELGKPLGMKSTSTSDKDVSKNKKVQAGLRNVAIELAREQIASQVASYDKSLAVLKALVPLHDRLQNGAPLNLAMLTDFTNQLQSIADALQPSKGK